MKRENMHLGAKPSLFQNAQTLRSHPTQAEERLWQFLRNSQIENTRFRRQHPLKQYVADFYTHEIKLVIELDGEYHQDSVQQFSDANRDYNLEIEGVYILRIKNEKVMSQIEDVIELIRNTVRTLKEKKSPRK